MTCLCFGLFSHQPIPSQNLQHSQAFCGGLYVRSNQQPFCHVSCQATCYTTPEERKILFEKIFACFLGITILGIGCFFVAKAHLIKKAESFSKDLPGRTWIFAAILLCSGTIFSFYKIIASYQAHLKNQIQASPNPEAVV